MQLPVVFFAVLAASWMQGGDAMNCSLRIIDDIKEFNKEITESNILSNNFERRPDWILYSTKGYYPNEDNIHSISTTWSAVGNYTTTFIYKDGSPPTTASGGPLKEKTGSTYDEATRVIRWHPHVTGLVDTFYKCKEFDMDGPPAAVLKVWKGYKEDDVKKAKELIEKLVGSELSKTFEVSF